jgi:Ca2+-binding RTX toxin-like protein
MPEMLESRRLFSGLPVVAPPVSFVAQPLSSTIIKLAWVDQSVNETGFVIGRGTNGLTFDTIITTGPDVTSWLDTNLDPNTHYFYRILADTESSGFSNAVFANGTTLTTDVDTFAQLIDNTGNVVADDPALQDDSVQLQVRGTSADDTIIVGLRSDKIEVNVNGAVLSFTASKINKITIQGLAGNDRIKINPGVSDRHSSIVNIFGGDGNDVITGGSGDDRIDGGAGNDGIAAGAGDDTVIGGLGNDVLYGQGGNDLLDGGAGNDKLLGGDGDDVLIAGKGRNRLFGQSGIDTLKGTVGIDELVQ